MPRATVLTRPVNRQRAAVVQQAFDRLKGSRIALFLQVKSRFTLSRRGNYRTQVRMVALRASAGRGSCCSSITTPHERF